MVAKRSPVGRKVKVIESTSPKLINAIGRVIAVVSNTHNTLYKIELDDEDLLDGYYYFATSKQVVFVQGG